MKYLLLILGLIMSFNMKSQTSYIFLAPGFEEIEALATVDAMRRAGMKVVEVAVADTKNVTGATGQTVVADSLITEIDPTDAEWIIIPGGQPGADNLHASPKVNEIIKNQFDRGGRIAAICAGPAVVVAPTGILKGKKATCYPGLGDMIESGGGTYVKEAVVVDGNIITSEGPGTTLKFAKAIICASEGEQKASEVLASMLMDN
ncbi:DJ-1 family glyoxalase III [Muribaculum intestinale]|uniref:DJ-1 family glyoxalase III n=2 Tax=Muribaculum intestinale TaxID=1796646 RepID=UPI00261F4351|nr:DJ-1 family glyoxalase III [Muribaculum intestinale]